eukprot:Pgem_evm1s6021
MIFFQNFQASIVLTALMHANFKFMVNDNICVSAHTEDICFHPNNGIMDFGVYKAAVTQEQLANITDFFSEAMDLDCQYGKKSKECLVSTAKPLLGNLVDTSICRGFVHFFNVYFTAAALGFTQEYSHFLAAYSQGIDFEQFYAIDSCGVEMNKRFWTPNMRGLPRDTEISFPRHLGIPYIGTHKGDTLSDKDKQFTSSDQICAPSRFNLKYEYYEKRCTSLNPDYSDYNYTGPLSTARDWAFMEPNAKLCVNGFTTIGKDGSPFTGTECASNNSFVYYNNLDKSIGLPVNTKISLGQHIINYAVDEYGQFYNYVLADDFGKYVESDEHAFAKTYDETGEFLIPVSEKIARMGLLVHWVSDRASHYYCNDAPGSGFALLKKDNSSEYDVNLFMDKGQCSVGIHSITHYWETGHDHLAPGTYSALKSTYLILKEFKDKNKDIHPEWFSENYTDGASFKELSFEEVVGNYDNRGLIFNATLKTTAYER